MIVTAVAAGWIAVSIFVAPVLGRGIALADHLATVPPAGSSGEEAPRRDLPAHLSPRAGSRRPRRFARRLRSYGWLVGLLLAAVLCVALSALQDLTPVTAIR